MFKPLSQYPYTMRRRERLRRQQRRETFFIAVIGSGLCLAMFALVAGSILDQLPTPATDRPVPSVTVDASRGLDQDAARATGGLR